MSICKQHITDFSQSQRRSNSITLHRRFIYDTNSAVICAVFFLSVDLTIDHIWSCLKLLYNALYLFIIIIPLLTVDILLPWHLGMSMNWENLAKTVSSIWSDSYSSFVCFHICEWKNEWRSFHSFNSLFFLFLPGA